MVTLLSVREKTSVFIPASRHFLAVIPYVERAAPHQEVSNCAKSAAKSMSGSMMIQSAHVRAAMYPSKLELPDSESVARGTSAE